MSPCLQFLSLVMGSVTCVYFVPEATERLFRAGIFLVRKTFVPQTIYADLDRVVHIVDDIIIFRLKPTLV